MVLHCEPSQLPKRMGRSAQRTHSCTHLDSTLILHLTTSSTLIEVLIILGFVLLGSVEFVHGDEE